MSIESRNRQEVGITIDLTNTDIAQTYAVPEHDLYQTGNDVVVYGAESQVQVEDDAIAKLKDIWTGDLNTLETTKAMMDDGLSEASSVQLEKANEVKNMTLDECIKNPNKFESFVNTIDKQSELLRIRLLQQHPAAVNVLQTSLTNIREGLAANRRARLVAQANRRESERQEADNDFAAKHLDLRKDTQNKISAFNALKNSIVEFQGRMGREIPEYREFALGLAELYFEEMDKKGDVENQRALLETVDSKLADIDKKLQAKFVSDNDKKELSVNMALFASTKKTYQAEIGAKEADLDVLQERIAPIRARDIEARAGLRQIIDGFSPVVVKADAEIIIAMSNEVSGYTDDQKREFLGSVRTDGELGLDSVAFDPYDDAEYAANEVRLNMLAAEYLAEGDSREPLQVDRLLRLARAVSIARVDRINDHISRLEDWYHAEVFRLSDERLEKHKTAENYYDLATGTIEGYTEKNLERARVYLEATLNQIKEDDKAIRATFDRLGALKKDLHGVVLEYQAYLEVYGTHQKVTEDYEARGERAHSDKADFQALFEEAAKNNEKLQKVLKEAGKKLDESSDDASIKNILLAVSANSNAMQVAATGEYGANNTIGAMSTGVEVEEKHQQRTMEKIVALKQAIKPIIDEAIVVMEGCATVGTSSHQAVYESIGHIAKSLNTLLTKPGLDSEGFMQQFAVKYATAVNRSESAAIRSRVALIGEQALMRTAEENAAQRSQPVSVMRKLAAVVGIVDDPRYVDPRAAGERAKQLMIEQAEKTTTANNTKEIEP